MPPSGVDGKMDEDAIIEAEIAQQLEQIDLDVDDLVDLNEEFDVEQDDGLGGDNPVSDDEEYIPPELVDYVQTIQKQTQAFERELEEVDDLLHHSDLLLNSSKEPYSNINRKLLEEAAEIAGEDPEEFRRRLLEDSKKDIDDNSDDEEEIISTDTKDLVPTLDESGEGVQNGEISNENPEDQKALVLVSENQLFFQQMMKREMEYMEKQRKERGERLEKELMEKKIIEEKEERQSEEKRLKIHHEIEKEKMELAQKQLVQKEKLEQEEKVKKEEIDIEIQCFEENIHKMEEEIQHEKEELTAIIKNEEEKNEQKQQEAAIKIQSRYRSYMVRREYKNMLEEKRIERKRRKQETRIKEVEQERKKIKREAEVERIKKEQEKKAVLEAEEKKKQEEQEKMKQEEEEKKRKEQEELKKREEEERLKKEKKELEEKKKEQERLRIEEERKKKEEEKRIEEEKRKREEEKRKREEEEKRQKEQERKIKEEEERKKREEQQREEEKRKEEEKRRIELQKEEEERKRKEKESEKLQVEKSLENGESVKHELQTKNKADLRKSSESIALRKLDKLSLRKSTEISKKSVEKESHVKADRNKISDNNTTEDDLDDLLFGEEEKDTDRKVQPSHNVIEGLPESMDKKRIQWIKDCLPWSKVSNEPWKLKLTNKNKRSVRRPSSAKKLQLLEENIITTAAKVETLRQVTTVQLQDLPGCNISTLGQCWGLKYLKMTNCNLVAVEGLQQCKQLQSVDFKDNYIEYIDLKDLGNLVYVNLSKNKISSVHGLDGCTNVRWIDLSHNRITRLGGLEELRRLHTLDLSHNQLISTNGISATPTLQVLNLSQNHLQNLEDIDKLCLLQSLDVTSNNLLKVPNLVNQVLLCSLLLEDNSISSIEELTQLWLPLLYTLNLGQNSLEDLVSLENYHVLQELNISNNQITESDNLLTCLCGCIYMDSITVTGNPLEDSGLSSSLLEKFTRLQNLDGTVIRSHDTIQPMKTRNSFEAMCLTQMQIFKNCQQRFDQDLRIAENKQPLDLQNLCDIHFKFCDKTHKLAVEHRYAHEYGEISMAMPSAPSTPKTNTSRPKSSRTRVIQKEEQQYMSPKEMFEKAIQGGGDKGGNSSRQSDVGSVMSKKESEMKSPRKKITADVVGKMLQNGNKYTRAEEEAAIRIQARWRGYSARKYFRNHINKTQNITKDDDDDFDMDVLQELHRAAVVIQSHWRGYSFRSRLMQALELAKFDDDDDFEFEDVDMGDFNFDESMLEDWRPPDTPQLPSSHHAILGKPPSGKQRSPPIKVPGLNLIETPQPPNLPRKAWRGMDSPLSDVHPPNRRVPRPPSSLANGSDTNRSMLSKKEEKITEEWGFKDSQTAHLMMQRAKKLKYNAARRKKLSKLDPKQRLALFRKLEEGTQPRTVYQQSRKTLPRKEYFQARQEEIERQDLEKRVEKNAKVNRTFEWIHTQVGNYDVSDSYIQQPQTTLKRVYGSDSNLPKLNPDITAGKPVRLVNSPVSIDLQSVDSASIHGDRVRSRRMSAGTEGSYTLPPIQTSSAPSIRPKEKMSWRSPNVDQSIGWGGGKKRTSKR